MMVSKMTLMYVIVQALKSKAFSNFTAIYLLLLERWQRCTRLFSMHAEHRPVEDRRRPSTVAEQAVIRFAVGSHPPTLSDTRTGPFSRTTDGVDLNAPHHATQQQRIYTSGPQPTVMEMGLCTPGPLAKMSIDEGVELECSENSYEMLSPPQAAAATSGARVNLASMSSSAGSSDVASFDSDILTSAVQSTPWAFTSGESISSSTGLECSSTGGTSQDFPADTSGTGTVENQPPVSGVPGRCYLAVPGPSNTLQVPAAGMQGGSQDGFFHSGRRASDGLATRTDILQLQQLMKSRGVPELQKELETLAVPADPRRPAEPRSRRVETRHGWPVQQYSFEEGACMPAGRLSPLSARKARLAVAGNCARPRLAALGRSRPPAQKSPLEELTTLCRMLPAGGTAERNRSPVNSEHQMLQRQFQQLGIDGTSSSLAAAAISLPASSGFIQLPASIGQDALAPCLSERQLATTSPPTTLSSVSACRSQDSVPSYTTNESIAPAHLPVGQPVTVADDGLSASVRRHMVRRTLYRLAHQQALISSFGEEDIPEVSPVSEQAAGASDTQRESLPSNNMDVT